MLDTHPMHNDGPKLRIQVSESWAHYRKGQLMLAGSGWSEVEFRFDPDKQGFAIVSARLGGI